MLTKTPTEKGIWGPKTVGAKLHINPLTIPLDPNKLTSFDVETDEKDNFVGIGICQDLHNVYYWSTFTKELKDFLRKAKLIAHNIKFDVGRLHDWGVKVTPEQLAHDTVIMSYCVSTTQETHHLKDLASQIFDWQWPTYKEMTKEGTLDKVDVERVAAYCGMDTLACLKLYYELMRKMNTAQLLYYHKIEMPMTRLLFLMELKGIKVDEGWLRKIDKQFAVEESELLDRLVEFVGKVMVQPEKQLKTKVRPAKYEDFNPNSPKQVGEFFLPKVGVETNGTGKDKLWPYLHLPMIKTLFDYRKMTKLRSTYTSSLLTNPTFPIIHTVFNQVSSKGDSMKGIRTGRLSSRSPNLQNIPARKPYGPFVRKAFVAREGKTLLCLDYSQIEYRLLAHYSQEPILLEAYRNSKDVHEETTRLFGLDPKKYRDIGKTLNFAAIYGAGGKKLAQTVSQTGNPMTAQEGYQHLDMYWKKLPRVRDWVNRVKFDAHANKAVTTLYGRRIPLPGIDSLDRKMMWHWERAAVNYIIQGSAAEVLKMAMLELWQQDRIPLLQVHDELVFEVSPDKAEELKNEITETMENIVKLSIPLEVSAGIGTTWDDAKA